MGTMKEEMTKVGFSLNEKDTATLKNSLSTLKKKTKKTFCKKCGEQIIFQSKEKKSTPLNPDGSPHWQSCPYQSFVQKKMSFDIAKKLAILFIIKHGTDLEAEAGLNKLEVKIVQAMLEKAFHEEEPRDARPALDTDVEETLKENKGGEAVKEDLSFRPVPCDPVGDPDEDRAPKEDIIHEAEVAFSKEKSVDKGVKKFISEPIVEDVLIPEGTPRAEK